LRQDLKRELEPIFLQVNALEKMVGYCGIVCSDCPVLTATQKNDDTERNRVAEMFTKQYGEEYTPEDINCDGCTSNGTRIFRYCSVCTVRKCGQDKKVRNCAFCGEYPCEKVSQVFAGYAKAKETLDSIRREHGIA
jgi:hypothetical protein